MIDKKFWQGKKVLLTGHTGFKGAWLTLWLKSLGVDLTGFALPPPTEPNFFEMAKLDRGMKSIEGDVRDLQKVKWVFEKTQPEIVIHMAAQALVRLSYETPVETYSTNVMGTVHLLEAARYTPNLRACLVITSDKCYENQETPLPYTEDKAMGGHDPYSSSKGCAEIVTSAYRRSFFRGQTVASARAGNVIGGGDWARDRLIPDILSALMKGEKAQIRNPKAVRPWQHVLEPLYGYLLLCEKLYSGATGFAKGWNFGPGHDSVLTVEQLADELVGRWGSGQWESVTLSEDQPHEALQLRLDSSRAQKSLLWKHKLPIREALKWVTEWYQGYNANKDIELLSLKQIDRYQKL